MEPSPRRLVIALAAGLGCALLVIAFLLGRLSARPTEPALSDRSPSAAGARVAPPSPLQAPADPTPLPSPASSLETSGALSIGTLPPLPAEPLSVPVPSVREPEPPLSQERQAIAAYFRQVDALDNVGAGDPQQFAQSLLASVTSGDFSGFDDLLTQARRQQERLRGISPPPACREHHRLALSLSAESVSMLETLRASLAKGDTTALMAMAERARDLENQTSELKAMAAAIRRRAGGS